MHGSPPYLTELRYASQRFGTIEGEGCDNAMRSPQRRYFNTEGIVVRARNLGEADRIVVLFTPNRGLISCVARGARRTTSKTGGHVDLLRHITAHISEGRSDLHVISQVETINGYLSLRNDLDRLSLASHFAEMCERFSLPNAANPNLFNLLRDSLTFTETRQANPPTPTPLARDDATLNRRPTTPTPPLRPHRSRHPTRRPLVLPIRRRPSKTPRQTDQRSHNSRSRCLHRGIRTLRPNHPRTTQHHQTPTPHHPNARVAEAGTVTRRSAGCRERIAARQARCSGISRRGEKGARSG